MLEQQQLVEEMTITGDEKQKYSITRFLFNRFYLNRSCYTPNSVRSLRMGEQEASSSNSLLNFKVPFTKKRKNTGEPNTETDPVAKKPKNAKLPNTMLIDAKTGKWTFVRRDSKEDGSSFLQRLVGNNCDRVEGMPIKQLLTDDNYALYADEEGLMKSGAMNFAYNPFCDASTIIYLTECGGPVGNLVLHREGGIISYSLLQKLTAALDLNRSTVWSDCLSEAVARWNVKSTSPKNT